MCGWKVRENCGVRVSVERKDTKDTKLLSNKHKHTNTYQYSQTHYPQAHLYTAGNTVLDSSPSSSSNPLGWGTALSCRPRSSPAKTHKTHTQEPVLDAPCPACLPARCFVFISVLMPLFPGSISVYLCVSIVTAIFTSAAGLAGNPQPATPLCFYCL